MWIFTKLLSRFSQLIQLCIENSLVNKQTRWVQNEPGGFRSQTLAIRALYKSYISDLKTSLKILEQNKKKYIFNQYLYTMIQNSVDLEKL